MTPTTLRRGRFVLIAAITLLVAFAATSAAGRALDDPPVAEHTNGPQYVTSTVAASAISRVTGVAPCPAGTRAIDGGVTSESEPYTHVVTSAAAADGSGWSVELWNQHPNRSLVAHVWAECLAIG